MVAEYRTPLSCLDDAAGGSLERGITVPARTVSVVAEYRTLLSSLDAATDGLLERMTTVSARVVSMVVEYRTPLSCPCGAAVELRELKALSPFGTVFLSPALGQRGGILIWVRVCISERS